MAGYSGTPLPKKLGIKPESRVLVLDGQSGFAKSFKAMVKVMQPNAGLWAAWPKKASGVQTEDTVRAVALPMGLVDNKVCAIDETWSGLRCVIRVENR